MKSYLEVINTNFSPRNDWPFLFIKTHYWLNVYICSLITKYKPYIVVPIDTTVPAHLTPVVVG